MLGVRLGGGLFVFGFGGAASSLIHAAEDSSASPTCVE
jgi:hypothetical protein